MSGSGIEVAAGRQAVIAAAARPSDFVMVAIMGAAAMEPALAAVARGAMVALANKECIVAAGDVFRDALAKSGAQVIPVDSEHNAIFQVLGSGEPREVETGHDHRFGRSVPRLDARTHARRHGRGGGRPSQLVDGRARFRVDSATLMNKGLELIEAHFLFALPPEKLGVVVHPQSIVHCLVSYADGTTLGASVGARHAHADRPCFGLAPAHRLAVAPARSCALGQLVFQAPAHDRFRCLGLAIDAMRPGGLRRPSSMPPTRSRWRPSWIAASDFWTFRAWSQPTLDGLGSNGIACDLESVLGDRCAGARAWPRKSVNG